MVQTGPGVGPVVVSDGCVAVATPGRGWSPFQTLVGAAAGCWAPYRTHTVPVRRWPAATAAATAATATGAMTTNPTH